MRDKNEEKDVKHCPKCRKSITHPFPRNRYYEPFECEKCGQTLCFVRYGAKGCSHRRHLYIDDQEHMGLMTSGVGGF